MNEELYNKITRAIEKSRYGILILIILNKLISGLVYGLYPLVLIILRINNHSSFWRSLLVPGVSFIVVSLFRKYFNAPRPYEVLDITPIIQKDTKGNSFPSRHVFSIFVIAMTLYYILAPLGITLLFLGIILGIIRVIGGVHFPKDVIAGAIIGILSSIIGYHIL